MNGYWGGAVAAIGGALVVGAHGRIVRAGNDRAAWALGAGAVILAVSRPFEGVILLVPVLVVLSLRHRRPGVWLPLTLIGTAGAAWLGYYNYRVTGSPLRMPYQEYFAQYETIPPFNILPLAPDGSRTFRHFNLEFLDKGWALRNYQASRTWRFFLQRPRDWYTMLRTMLGSVVWILVLALGLRPVRAPESRFLWLLLGAGLAGSLIEVSYHPHYGAPLTAVILILTVQTLRTVRPMVPLLAALAFAFMVWNDASQIFHHQTPDAFRSKNSHKGEIERRLADRVPGDHVVFVRYTGAQDPHEEWIYNAADIDGSPVIWAQDMGEARNRRLIAYYPHRAFWMFQPDNSLDDLAPYKPGT
jgi:hypothetical protein